MAYLFLSFLILSSASSYAGNYTSFVSLSRNKLLELPPLLCAMDLTVTNQACCNNSAFPHQNTSRFESTNTLNFNIEQQNRGKKMKKFSCPECNKRIGSKYSLKRHRETTCGKNRNPKGKYPCDKCEKTYDVKGSLSRHKKIHESKPVYSCEFCGGEFTQKCSLVRHIVKETCKEMKKNSNDKKKRKNTDRSIRSKLDTLSDHLNHLKVS